MANEDRPIVTLIRLLRYVHANGASREQVAALKGALDRAAARFAQLPRYIESASRELARVLDYSETPPRSLYVDQSVDTLLVLFGRLREEYIETDVKPQLPELVTPTKERAPTAEGIPYFVVRLGALPLPTLRGIWSRTIKFQDQRGFPRKKEEAVNDLAAYYVDWQDGNPEVLDETLRDVEEFGADKTSIRDIKRQNEE